jgi:hypothetical protein
MRKSIAVIVTFVAATSLTLSACGGESKASKCKKTQELLDQNSETITKIQSSSSFTSTPQGQAMLSEARRLKAEIQSEFDSLGCS